MNSQRVRLTAEMALTGAHCNYAGTARAGVAAHGLVMSHQTIPCRYTCYSNSCETECEIGTKCHMGCQKKEWYPRQFTWMPFCSCRAE